MDVTANLTVEVIAEQTGGWCRHCQLPSLTTGVFQYRLGDAPSGPIEAITFCHGSDECPMALVLG